MRYNQFLALLIITLLLGCTGSKKEEPIPFMKVLQVTEGTPVEWISDSNVAVAAPDSLSLIGGDSAKYATLTIGSLICKYRGLQYSYELITCSTPSNQYQLHIGEKLTLSSKVKPDVIVEAIIREATNETSNRN